jgi:16S rRNA (guanine527-N7)-methyltransferase
LSKLAIFGDLLCCSPKFLAWVRLKYMKVASLAYLILISIMLSFTFSFRKLQAVLSRRRLCSTANYFTTDMQPFLTSFPHLTPVQVEHLGEFVKVTKDWNTRVNLVSRKDVDNLVSRHVIPSLSITLVRNFGTNESIIDVGTGGGFPGIPLAIACPHARFTLLDSSSKKMNVVADMVRHLGLTNVEVVTARAEEHTEKKYSFVLGRAVTSLSDFVSWTAHLLQRAPSTAGPGGSPTGGILYLKGGEIEAELKQLRVKRHRVYHIKDLVSGLETDKFILHLPASEVRVPARQR